MWFAAECKVAKAACKKRACSLTAMTTQHTFSPLSLKDKLGPCLLLSSTSVHLWCEVGSEKAKVWRERDKCTHEAFSQTSRYNKPDSPSVPFSFQSSAPLCSSSTSVIISTHNGSSKLHSSQPYLIARWHHRQCCFQSGVKERAR